jgi:hypothetical protein
LAALYGLTIPECKLIELNKAAIQTQLSTLCETGNTRTQKEASQLTETINKTPANYLFLMKFFVGSGLDSIDSNPEKLELFGEKKFLKSPGYALPFDAWICNGDRFSSINPDLSANPGNMIMDQTGEFIAIDNGINALQFVPDYEEFTSDFYHAIFRNIVTAVSTGNRNAIATFARDIANSLILDCPKLMLRPEQTQFIEDGIIAGVKQIKELKEADIMAIYSAIPTDSGIAESDLHIILNGLRIARED